MQGMTTVAPACVCGSVRGRAAVGCGSRLAAARMPAVSIRIDLVFAQPLDQDAHVRLLLAAAGLPEVRRATLSADRTRSTWYAGELPLARISAALAESGLAAAELRSGLAPETEEALAAPPGERFRPIGR
jgi:hypothetical protein